MSYVIAVTNPQGRTRYVGETIPWVDDIVAAYGFDSEVDAQSYIDHPNTIVSGRVREGWKAEVVQREFRVVA